MNQTSQSLEICEVFYSQKILARKRAKSSLIAHESRSLRGACHETALG
jgi:hypothetical protein